MQLADVDSIVPSAANRLGGISIPYHFEWTEAEHGFEFIDATRYMLEVAPDKPPIITIYKPLHAVTATRCWRQRAWCKSFAMRSPMTMAQATLASFIASMAVQKHS